MELYLAGSYLFPSKMDIYILNYNRLLSYDYQKKHIDTILEIKKQYEELMELYLAGTDQFGHERRVKYLELYLAGGTTEKEGLMDEVIRSNVLFNYIDGKRATDKYKEIIKPKKLFVDSGAFSAWTKGKQIDVDEYIKWINDRSEYIDLCGQIDSIPGDRIKGATKEQVEEAARATWENYLYMRDKMIKPDMLLYTFHVGEPYNYLQQALEWTDEKGKHIPYIALGGMVGKPMPVKTSFLDSCFNFIKKSSNPNVKVHAFGMTSFKLLESYPITSADSTSWIMVGATGGIMTDMGTIAVSDIMAREQNHYSHLSIEHQEAFNQQIAPFGFTLDELRISRDNRIMFNARYMNKKAQELVYNPGPKKFKLF